MQAINHYLRRDDEVEEEKILSNYDALRYICKHILVDLIYRYPSREYKHDIKHSQGNTFNPIFKVNVQWRKHPARNAFAKQNYLVTDILHM